MLSRPAPRGTDNQRRILRSSAKAKSKARQPSKSPPPPHVSDDDSYIPPTASCSAKRMSAPAPKPKKEEVPALDIVDPIGEHQLGTGKGLVFPKSVASQIVNERDKHEGSVTPKPAPSTPNEPSKTTRVKIKRPATSTTKPPSSTAADELEKEEGIFYWETYNRKTGALLHAWKINAPGRARKSQWEIGDPVGSPRGRYGSMKREKRVVEDEHDVVRAENKKRKELEEREMEKEMPKRRKLEGWKDEGVICPAFTFDDGYDSNKDLEDLGDEGDTTITAGDNMSGNTISPEVGYMMLVPGHPGGPIPEGVRPIWTIDPKHFPNSPYVPQGKESAIDPSLTSTDGEKENVIDPSLSNLTPQVYSLEERFPFLDKKKAVEELEVSRMGHGYPGGYKYGFDEEDNHHHGGLVDPLFEELLLLEMGGVMKGSVSVGVY